jgi:hypothetical protein
LLKLAGVGRVLRELTGADGSARSGRMPGAPGPRTGGLWSWLPIAVPSLRLTSSRSRLLSSCRSGAHMDSDRDPGWARREWP